MRFFSENVDKSDIEPAEPVIQPKTSILPSTPTIFHRPLRIGILKNINVSLLNRKFVIYMVLGYDSDKGETENIENIGDSSDSWSTTSDAIDEANKNALKWDIII